MQKKINAREIRLVLAVGALLVCAMATTTPGGGLTCCGGLEPDMTVTFVNNHTENAGEGILPNIVVIILDTKNEGGITTIKSTMTPGKSTSHTLPGGGFYVYTAFELDYSLIIPQAGKCIDTGTIIADDTITIN